MDALQAWLRDRAGIASTDLDRVRAKGGGARGGGGAEGPLVLVLLLWWW